MHSNYSWLMLIFLDFFLCHCCCVVVSDWPKGYYGLPMANTGCPVGATFKWKTGWIFQDTEDKNPMNSKSKSFHLDGQVRPSSVNRSFCIKTFIGGDHNRPFWPAGTYCIYQRTSSCPTAFTWGSVSWSDEANDNKNRHKGTLPKNLNYWAKTRIYLCCRSDGRKTTPIDLPTASPFYLFAHTSEECQQVRWAVSTSEWIYYDTDDVYNSYDSVTHPAPYVTSGQDSGHKIHYCYYTSCQYTLNTSSTGWIQSPRFPSNYPNGQQCSWRISVKASQTILVHFVNFSLSDMGDQLIFYDGKDDAAPRVATLNGKSTSRTVPRDVPSSSSNLFVVFSSNSLGSSFGFHASYKAVDISSSPPPTTTATAATTVTTKTTTTTKTTAQVQTKTTQQTENPNVATTSYDSPSTSACEPTNFEGNSSKTYERFKDSQTQQSRSGLIAVAVVIPLICIIAVIAMAAYLFFRLRNLPKQPGDVSVRYTSESVNNPSYIQSDAVIEARAPTTNHTYEDSKGDVYDEVEYQAQTTDNPLYQSTNTDNHVYASFA